MKNLLINILVIFFLFGSHSSKGQNSLEQDFLNLINEYRANPNRLLDWLDQANRNQFDTTSMEFKEFQIQMEDLNFFATRVGGLSPLVCIEPVRNSKIKSDKNNVESINSLTLHSFGDSECDVFFNMLYYSNYTPVDVQEFILSTNMISISVDEVQGDIVLLKFGFEN